MKSPEAWIIIGLAGVAVSIVAVYVVRWLDRGTNAFVGWLAHLGQKRQADRAARVAAARSNRDLLNLFKVRAVSLRLRGVALLILSLALAGLGTSLRYVTNDPWTFPVGCVSSAITALVAIGLIGRAISTEAEMRDAEKAGG